MGRVCTRRVALLYVDGSAPYRSEEVVSKIDSSTTLVDRLEAYRTEIVNAPPPLAHRSVNGVDRELLHIIDRCLAVEPSERFPNVQSVLTALRARDATKDRKPLLLLGLLGPLLFFAVLGIYGANVWHTASVDSDRMVRTWANASSQFAAKFVAEAVARRIDNYFRLVETEAEDIQLQRQVELVQDSLAGVLAKLADDRLSEVERERLRNAFIDDPVRQTLAARMDDLISQGNDNVASWFVTDPHGVQLASSVVNDKAKNSTVGGDYSRRAYFYGGKEDLPAGEHYSHGPLSHTKLSPVFRSDASGTWKVAVSTPVMKNGDPIGVMALTVELGRLGEKEDFVANNRRFVTLVDGRDGSHRGQVLQHPLFKEILAKADQTSSKPVLGDFSKYKVPIDDLPQANAIEPDVALYRDPIADSPAGKAYDRNWLARQAPVKLKTLDTGLIVLVQEDYDLAAAPVRKLGDEILRNGLWALSLALIGVIYLWYVATRALRDPNEAMRRAGGVTVSPSSLHSMETLELPEKLRSGTRKT